MFLLRGDVRYNDMVYEGRLLRCLTMGGCHQMSSGGRSDAFQSKSGPMRASLRNFRSVGFEDHEKSTDMCAFGRCDYLVCGVGFRWICLRDDFKKNCVFLLRGRCVNE